MINISKLGLRLEGTALEPLIRQFHDEISAKELVLHRPYKLDWINQSSLSGAAFVKEKVELPARGVVLDLLVPRDVVLL